MGRPSQGRRASKHSPAYLPLSDRAVRSASACHGKYHQFPNRATTRQKDEEATRQQGGLFFRENSSNGGKAIRTFWRNTKFGQKRCQGLNAIPITHYLGISYGGYLSDNSPFEFAKNSPSDIPAAIKNPSNERLTLPPAPSSVQKVLQRERLYAVPDWPASGPSE